jgi:hypothetical protein
MTDSAPPSSRTMQAAQHPAIWTGFTLALVMTVRAFFGEKLTEVQTQALMGLAGTVGTLVAYYMPSPPKPWRKKSPPP